MDLRVRPKNRHIVHTITLGSLKTTSLNLSQKAQKYWTFCRQKVNQFFGGPIERKTFKLRRCYRQLDFYTTCSCFFGMNGCLNLNIARYNSLIGHLDGYVKPYDNGIHVNRLKFREKSKTTGTHLGFEWQCRFYYQSLY